MPSQVAGVRLWQVLLTRDGRSYVHTYSQVLSNLYIAEGLPRSHGTQSHAAIPGYHGTAIWTISTMPMTGILPMRPEVP